jgi:hypothetical protein
MRRKIRRHANGACLSSECNQRRHSRLDTEFTRRQCVIVTGIGLALQLCFNSDWSRQGMPP